MNHCTGCHAELSPHNVVGLCLECKHIERDRRRGFTAEEVTLDQARTNFMAVFAGHYRQQSADAVYMAGACSKCARYRARHDTGRCESCSRPWISRPKKKRAA